jgi:hypothetical protein
MASMSFEETREKEGKKKHGRNRIIAPKLPWTTPTRKGQRGASNDTIEWSFWLLRDIARAACTARCAH